MVLIVIVIMCGRVPVPDPEPVAVSNTELIGRQRGTWHVVEVEVGRSAGFGYWPVELKRKPKVCYEPVGGRPFQKCT